MSNKNKRLAFEVDERGHGGYCKQKEKIRESVIRKDWGVKFIGSIQTRKILMCLECWGKLFNWLDENRV